MGHIHEVRDTDVYFKIDPVTRTVVNVKDTKQNLFKGDHNSERFTFELPRKIDGHDMTSCDKVEVHYINTSSGSDGKYSADIYLVDDIHASEDNEDILLFSWLISSTATQHVGQLSFTIRFTCFEDHDMLKLPTYIWNTAVHSSVKVISSITNDNIITNTNTEAYKQWEAKLFENISNVEYLESPTDMTDILVVEDGVMKKYPGAFISDFMDDQQSQAPQSANTVVGVIDSHYYNFRLLNEERGATMDEIREAALSEDKDIVIRLDLDNWQGTLHYLGLVDLTDDGSTYQKVLLFSTVKMNNGIINTSDNIVSGDVLLEYWYTTVESGTIMPPNAFMNCQFAKINLAPGAKHAGSFMRVNEDGLWDVEKIDIVQSPATASVGQTLAVKAVDDNGKPIEWEAVDAGNAGNTSDSTKLTLIDEVTGSKYELKVANGKLTMTEVDS